MAHVGVVDGLVPALVLVRFEVAGPEFDEAWAQRGEFADQSLQWWAKLIMASASLVRLLAGINTLEQAGNAIADLGLGMIVRPPGRIYASLVKGRLTWPDPSELAQSDTAMKELWVDSAYMVGMLA